MTPTRSATTSRPAIASGRLSRRDSLAAMVGGYASFTSIGVAADETARRPQAARAPNPGGTVVDTHLHCFAGPDDSRFPYHQRAPYRPAAAASPEHLLRCMDGAGVDRAIVVHPEPYQDDHRYLEYCLRVGGQRLKGTCLFFADRPDSLRRMPGFLRRHEGRIIAARIHAYAPRRLPPFGRPELRRLWKIASDAGIAVQLHLEPRYAAAMDPYLQEFAGTAVIIDHLGRPMQGTPDEHAVVMKWSELPRTTMKLSAIPRRDQYPHRDVAPIIRSITDAWGPDRLIYGGGFGATATGASYRQYRDQLAGYLAHLSAEDRARVFGGNAMRLFEFPLAADSG